MGKYCTLSSLKLRLLFTRCYEITENGKGWPHSTYGRNGYVYRILFWKLEVTIVFIGPLA